MSEVKRESLGQCIIKAVAPRKVIPPILFGLGNGLDYLFGSKWLINELCRLGFCISFDQEQR